MHYAYMTIDNNVLLQKPPLPWQLKNLFGWNHNSCRVQSDPSLHLSHSVGLGWAHGLDCCMMTQQAG